MDALKIYEDALDDLATDLITEDEFTKIIKCLRDVQEVKHGHWNLFDDDWNAYECSVCGEVITLNAGSPKENNMNYCWNCGAKMEVDK